MSSVALAPKFTGAKPWSRSSAKATAAPVFGLGGPSAPPMRTRMSSVVSMAYRVVAVAGIAPEVLVYPTAARSDSSRASSNPRYASFTSK